MTIDYCLFHHSPSYFHLPLKHLHSRAIEPDIGEAVAVFFIFNTEGATLGGYFNTIKANIVVVAYQGGCRYTGTAGIGFVFHTALIGADNNMVIVVRKKIIEGDFRGENEISNAEVNFFPSADVSCLRLRVIPHLAGSEDFRCIPASGSTKE